MHKYESFYEILVEVGSSDSSFHLSVMLSNKSRRILRESCTWKKNGRRNEAKVGFEMKRCPLREAAVRQRDVPV